jgi:tellurite resistance protein TerC
MPVGQGEEHATMAAARAIEGSARASSAIAEQVPLWAWLGFGALLVALLTIDLVLHRGSRLRSRSAAITWSAVWVGIGLGFVFVVWAALGGRRAGEYLAAYLIEESLSIDNLFVFLVVFRTLGIPHESQRAVLSWGLLGALVFRLVFIFVGVAAIERYHWVVYGFAVILLWAAVRTLRESPAAKTDSRAAGWLARHLPMTREIHGRAFFVKENGRRLATPLFAALVAVELVDIVFAVDSVPAALAISDSRFIVYSSNALAVLGLRSLYILLEDLIGELQYLHYGLAAVLAFAAIKLVTDRWIEIPPAVSIAIIVACLTAAIWPSLRIRRRRRAEAARKVSSRPGQDGHGPTARTVGSGPTAS